MEASVDALPRPHVVPRSSAIAWPAVLFLIGATSILSGLLWDISWHKTIGRDTFWTPAHLLIHFGGITAGLTGAFLILWTTLGGDADARAASVKVWGFRGPFGAWLSIWGCFAMLTSAPFDDWWHNAYGLDVKILSPPHTVLALGMFAVVYGAVLNVVARQNRMGDAEPWLKYAYVYAGGIVIAMMAIVVAEYMDPNQQHGALFYWIAAGFFPYMLMGLGRAARVRWPMTAIAAVYMGSIVVMNLILQLFPAHPRLAPIYIPVDHMVPFAFPVLLVAPAFACDLLMRRLGERNDWLLAALLSVTFVGVLLATSWYFAEFMLTPWADNPFFVGSMRHIPYFNQPGTWMHEFWDAQRDPVTLPKLGIAVVLAFVSARIGLSRGRWMRQVVR